MKVAEAILHKRHAQNHLRAAWRELNSQNYGTLRTHLVELDADLEWIEKCLTDQQ